MRREIRRFLSVGVPIISPIQQMFLSVVVRVAFRDFIEGACNSVRMIVQVRSVTLIVINVVSALPDLQVGGGVKGSHRNPFFPRACRILMNFVPQIVRFCVVVFMVRLSNSMVPDMFDRFTDNVHVCVVAIVCSG